MADFESGEIMDLRKFWRKKIIYYETWVGKERSKRIR
jgi:hypothetical protein